MFLPGESQGRGNLVGCRLWDRTKLLSLFWFHDGEIRFEACFTQVFLIHSCSTMESGFFLAMAFDHYIAICNPLRHTSILTHSTIRCFPFDPLPLRMWV